MSDVRSLFKKIFPFFLTCNETKRFSDFAETLHIDSTPKVNFLIFGVKRENFLMGLKIDFEFFEVGQFY